MSSGYDLRNPAQRDAARRRAETLWADKTRRQTDAVLVREGEKQDAMLKTARLRELRLAKEAEERAATGRPSRTGARKTGDGSPGEHR